jgi:hypothetical protein
VFFLQEDVALFHFEGLLMDDKENDERFEVGNQQMLSFNAAFWCRSVFCRCCGACFSQLLQEAALLVWPVLCCAE